MRSTHLQSLFEWTKITLGGYFLRAIILTLFLACLPATAVGSAGNPLYLDPNLAADVELESATWHKSVKPLSPNDLDLSTFKPISIDEKVTYTSSKNFGST